MRRINSWLLTLGAAGALALAGCSSAARSVNDEGVARPVAVAEDQSERPARKALVVSLGDERRAPVEKADRPEEKKKEAAEKADRPEEKKKETGPPFKLPDDRGGQLLGKALAPRTPAGTLNPTDRPAPPAAPAPRFAESPATPPAGTALVARIPSPARKDLLRPRLVTDETFDGTLSEPVPPRSPSFDPGKPVAVPAEDVSIPPPLPILAQPTLDRVPVDDFTTEASAEAVLSAPLPRRVTPAPFTRSGVPEPFENRKPLTTKAPDEETSPVADGPAVPKK
jgi:hypothetical protein